MSHSENMFDLYTLMTTNTEDMFKLNSDEWVLHNCGHYYFIQSAFLNIMRREIRSALSS